MSLLRPQVPRPTTDDDATNEHNDWYADALRHLFNRPLNQFYHCLQHHELFDEHTAFPTQLAACSEEPLPHDMGCTTSIRQHPGQNLRPLDHH